jgi:hypothetical protein
MIIGTDEPKYSKQRSPAVPFSQSHSHMDVLGLPRALRSKQPPYDGINIRIIMKLRLGEGL